MVVGALVVVIVLILPPLSRGGGQAVGKRL